MKMKPLGFFALLTLVSTIVWLVLMVAGLSSAGALDTLDGILAHVGKLDALHYATYINAGFLTLFNMIFFTALYRRYQSAAPLLALVGWMWIPVYGTLNLVVYLSQVTVVPGLFELYHSPEHRTAAVLGLQMLVQLWPTSFISFINVLAYALLGISSILFATLINREEPELRWLRLGVFLLELNGVACLIGLIGLIANHSLMMSGTALGGALFLGALAPLTLFYMKN
jgi:hypothetical protein